MDFKEFSIVIGGLITTIIAYFGGRRKNKAEAKMLETKAGTEVADNYERFSDRLENRLNSIEQENARLLREINKRFSESLDLKEKIHLNELALIQLRKRNEELKSVQEERESRIDELERHITELETELTKTREELKKYRKEH